MFIIVPHRSVTSVPWPLITSCVILLAWCHSARGDEIQVSLAMEADPLLVVPPVAWKLPDGTVSLWRTGLARPEAEYQLRVSESVAQAHSGGFPGMDSLKPDLLRILTAESTHPAARFASARALIALDARDESGSLLAAAGGHGHEMQLLIEPVLAGWDYEPARTVWLERLTNPNVRRRELILAAECAGTVRDPAALPPLVAYALSGAQTPDIRLAAARGAGAIVESGLEEDAGPLASSGSIVDRLCAVALLARHASPSAQRILLALAVDAEPSIAASALGALLSIDPALVLPLVSQAIVNGDPIVRLRGAEALIALPTPERIADLSALLDDPHVDVRVHVRDAMLAHAEQEDLSLSVRESAQRVLEGDGWRGQEQAALLLGALDHEPSAPRLIELQDADRPEAKIAAAWALREMAIPETAPLLLDKTDRLTTDRLNGVGNLAGVDWQVALLFEALGILKHSQAEPLLRRYVPKNYAYGELSRGAAVWALGHLHAGEADDELAAQLMARATDFNPISPESPIVQAMSIISIGRMQAASQLSRLHELIGPTVDPSDREYQIAWAIQQISGEDLPPAPPVEQIREGWFLQPLVE